MRHSNSFHLSTGLWVKASSTALQLHEVTASSDQTACVFTLRVFLSSQSTDISKKSLYFIVLPQIMLLEFQLVFYNSFLYLGFYIC